MNPSAYERLFELLERSELSQTVVETVLAAADGPEALLAQLNGERLPRAPERVVAFDAEQRQVYLEEISVEGFRGVGARARLQFEPAAGFTVVVGRNGSGKSSFAEALEVLLTGTTLRWEERTRVWREGWCNLHHPGSTEIAADFRIDGEREPLRLSRRWDPGQPLEGGHGVVVDGAQHSWDGLAWERPLERFRPILSYNELGKMFSSRAAALYEALSAVLGLEEFDAVLATLRQERLSRERTSKDEKQVRADVRRRLEACEDTRAPVLLAQLAARAPNFDQAWRLVESEEMGPGMDARALAALEVPSGDFVEAVFEGARSPSSVSGRGSKVTAANGRSSSRAK